MCSRPLRRSDILAALGEPIDPRAFRTPPCEVKQVEAPVEVKASPITLFMFVSNADPPQNVIDLLHGDNALKQYSALFDNRTPSELFEMFGCRALWVDIRNARARRWLSASLSPTVLGQFNVVISPQYHNRVQKAAKWVSQARAAVPEALELAYKDLSALRALDLAGLREGLRDVVSLSAPVSLIDSLLEVAGIHRAGVIR